MRKIRYWIRYIKTEYLLWRDEVDIHYWFKDRQHEQRLYDRYERRRKS